MTATIPAGAKVPADHKKKPAKKTGQPQSGQQAEALDSEMTVDFDGEQWTLRPSDMNDLEFLAAVADADANEDVAGLIQAMRMLLGGEQASRFFKGRKVEHIRDFFDTLGELVNSGNS